MRAGALAAGAEERAIGMKGTLITGILLVALGVAALVYKGVSYTEEETILQIGPMKATAATEKHVFVPEWAAYVGIGLGAVLIVAGLRR